MFKPLTPFELTLHIRLLIENDETLQQVWVSGEISNCKVHSSGHMYLTLKDDRATVRAVMWKTQVQALRFVPKDGMRVIVRGKVSVYERDGQYQLYIAALQPDGAGELYLAYEQLKEKLEQEGLFAVERKKPIPKFPRVVAVLTSPTGAAIKDILSVISRRWPLTNILVVPVAVQGVSAPASIVEAFTLLKSVLDIDLVIVGRGGGSIEELWAFNDESVARAIASCSIPTISAIGHESDFTIADFVADLRAPTPSAAAELAVPDSYTIMNQLRYLDGRLQSEWEHLFALKIEQ
ncbi:MAG: exodeoxyribonuclease VII large subunit, partial [bacterium]|nr:exodeoxyribonuclease VII large subunit [bacterium]